MATAPLLMVLRAFASLGSTRATGEARSTNSGDERAAAVGRRPWLQWMKRCGERFHAVRIFFVVLAVPRVGLDALTIVAVLLVAPHRPARCVTRFSPRDAAENGSFKGSCLGRRNDGRRFVLASTLSPVEWPVPPS